MTDPTHQVRPSTAGDRAALTDWLAHAGRPGAGALRRAAGVRVAAVVAEIGQWVSFTWLLVHGHDLATARGAGAVTLAVVAVCARAGARSLADRLAADGERSIVDTLRDHVVDAVFPDRIGPDQPPAAAAHSVIDLTEAVGAFHRRTRPARLAATPSALVTLVVVAVVHWPVAVLLALATPIVPANLRLAGWSAADAAEHQLDEVRRLSTLLLDRFTGLRTLRTLGAVDREAVTVAAAADALSRATMRVLRRAFVAGAVLDTVVTFAIAVAATYVGMTLLGYVHVPGTSHLGLAAGLLVLILVPVYFTPVREVAAGYHERDLALAAAERLRASPVPFDPPAPSPGRPHHRTAPTAEPTPPGARSGEAPRLVVRGLELSPGGRPLLDGIDLDTEPGRIVALVGPSGSGKSTLLACLAGLRPPQAGTIEWTYADGTSASPTAGRASWVGQDTVILAGSLADNIALADPTAAEPTIRAAALAAGLRPLLDRLPDGLNAALGDGGHGVSAGEARRVALARAVLRGAGLWLLDEPTAHLDARTEAEVLDTVLTAAAGRTVVIATHSSPLTARADTVWRIEHGTILVGAHTAMAGPTPRERR